MKLYTLGPAGTFSHEAAQKIFPDATIRFAPNFDALFEALERTKGAIGLVPLENSQHGAVDEVLDLLVRSPVKIWQTHDVAIRHAFGALDPKKVKRIASHPQALGQCRDFLRRRFPKTELLAVSSTSHAIELALRDPAIGAIALIETMRKKKLPVVEKEIQKKGNTTRFAILARTDPRPRAKKTQVSIVLHPTEDRPGLLHDLLTPFKIFDVNLTKIESRPTGEKIGDYLFFVDFLGTTASPRVRKMFEEIERFAKIKVLGEW